ncbi:WXG100 family type VII secretion target [Catenulispora pinisilvae]|uniref:WXG100 family type VII secretion target n=1 Tax=Catenulispora pinisilvae TaxID=2705253 RepID=UPI0018914B63|nr:WXG100 family type VII secretion target [Catenulispora pinisilvae]
MTFVANTDNMGQLVTTLGTASRNIEDRLSALQAYGDRLKSTWTGPAGDAYEEQKLNWDRAAATMNELLATFGVKLNDITDSILQTEQAATNRWSSTGSPGSTGSPLSPSLYSPVTPGHYDAGTVPLAPRLYEGGITQASPRLHAAQFQPQMVDRQD